MNCSEKIQEALECRIKASNLKWNIKRYSDKKDFQSLWELGDAGLDKDKNIIVIWDGFPKNDYSDNDPCERIYLEQFITPIDWALKNLIQHTTMNIVILDIHSHEFSYQGNSIKQCHENILQQLEEHVRYYSFYIKNFETITKSPLNLLDDINAQKNTKQSVVQECLKNLFKDRKVAIIEQSNEQIKDHHNVDNILGAVLLKAEELPAKVLKRIQIEGRASIHGKAFIQSFHIDGKAHEEQNLSHNLKDTNLVLVDDQVEYDWIELLCGWVYGECPNTEEDNGYYKVHKKVHKKDDKKLIYSANNATGEDEYGYASLLIKKLEKTIENLKKNNDSDKLRNGRFFFNFTGNGIKDEILIFDLYLFPEDHATEEIYLKKVFSLAEKLEEINGILSSDDTEASKADTEASKILESGDIRDIKNIAHYIRCLTLLPRLIAEIDPSIPIMVFSATASPDLPRLFRKYENIRVIPKHRFSGHPTPQSQPREEFYRALKNAIKFIKVRKRLRKLLEHYRDMSEKIEKKSINNSPIKDKIILYTDETGTLGKDDYFAVGGCYLVYDEDWENDREKWERKVLSNKIYKKDWESHKKTKKSSDHGVPYKDRCKDPKEKRRIKLLSNLPVEWNNVTYPLHGIKIVAERPRFKEKRLDRQEIEQVIKSFIRAIFAAYNNDVPKDEKIKELQKGIDQDEFIREWQIGAISDEYIKANAKAFKVKASIDESGIARFRFQIWCKELNAINAREEVNQSQDITPPVKEFLDKTIEAILDKTIVRFVTEILKAYNIKSPIKSEKLKGCVPQSEFIRKVQNGKISDDYIKSKAKVLINQISLQKFHIEFNKSIKDLTITTEIASRSHSLLNLYRKMVRQLLELFLSVLLPIQKIKEDTNITIVCAKRIIPCYQTMRYLLPSLPVPVEQQAQKAGGAYFEIPCLYVDTGNDLTRWIKEKIEIPYEVTAKVISMDKSDFIHHMADAVLCTTKIDDGIEERYISSDVNTNTNLKEIINRLFNYPGMEVDNMKYEVTQGDDLYEFEVVDPFIEANRKLWAKKDEDDNRYVNALSIIIENKVWFEFEKSIEKKKSDELTNNITSCICYLLAKEACRKISTKGIYALVEAPDSEQDKDVNIAASDSEQDKDVNKSIGLSTNTSADTYRAGDTFRDCATYPEMVVVPSGSFMMGSPADEPDRYDDEGPQHRVTIPKPFAVSKHAVTVGQFEEFANETRHRSNEWRDPGFNQSANHPVVKVSWDDAKAYTEWLSTKTGQNYRLLSEAEWEYVARAGTTTAYYFGETISRRQANYENDGTVKVGSYPKNAFGLYNVHGNVWEWVEDCWHDDYNDAPSDGSAWTGDCNSEPQHGVLRGGSWFNDRKDLRSTRRDKCNAKVRSNTGGFRIARTLTL